MRNCCKIVRYLKLYCYDIIVDFMVEKKDFSDETTLAKSSELVRTMAASSSIDLLPTFLTQLEFEILNLLLFWQTDLPQKYIENVIQTVYIFDRAEKISLQDIQDAKASFFLKEFVELFQTYNGKTTLSVEKREFAKSKIRTEYFTPDDKKPVERKRLTLVAEINKIVPKPLAIPSHRAISNTLLNLEAQGYIRRKRIRAKTLWNVDPNFLQMRMERHNQIIDEFVKLRNESKESTKMERERDAMDILLRKYSPALLEFLDIKYWIYLPFYRPVSLVVRCKDDLKALTRY